MTRFKILHASLLLAAAAATPAFSQMQMEKGPMASPPSTKASEGHINAMMLCQKMSPQVMMKNKSCAAMMKVHPNMMKMSKGDMNMMKSCQKMSHSAMMGESWMHDDDQDEPRYDEHGPRDDAPSLRAFHGSLS